MQHAAFGRINPYGPNYENVSLSTFGLFPNLFGLQIAYPHVNEPPREEPPANQDDGMSDLGKCFENEEGEGLVVARAQSVACELT